MRLRSCELFAAIVPLVNGPLLLGQKAGPSWKQHIEEGPKATYLCLENYASLLRTMGRHDEAESMAARALAVRGNKTND
jgi:hypothetical protein